MVMHPGSLLETALPKLLRQPAEGVASSGWQTRRIRRDWDVSQQAEIT